MTIHPAIEAMARALCGSDCEMYPVWDKASPFARKCIARSLTAALRAAETAGFVLVPKRATDQMCAAMDDIEPETLWQEVWAAGVAARPKLTETSR